MPLYDFVVMVKPQVARQGVLEVMLRLGQRVFAKRGVITNVKSFGRVPLAYSIKKRDGRYNEAQMMQMTMMVSPTIAAELMYLNKDERLLRWIIIKSRGTSWLKEAGARES